MTSLRHLGLCLLTICALACRDASPEAQVKAAFARCVELQGKRVRQRVEVVLTSRTPGGLLPQDAGHRRFDLLWVEAGGTYRLQRFSEAP